MACKPTATLIPSNVTYSSPSRAFSAMNRLSPGGQLQYFCQLQQIASAIGECALQSRCREFRSGAHCGAYFFAITSPDSRRAQSPLRIERASKPFIISEFHTLKNNAPATSAFSITSTLFEKQPGVWASEAYPRLPILGTPPCSRDRSPDRGPFPKILPRTPDRNIPSPRPWRHTRRTLDRPDLGADPVGSAKKRAGHLQPIFTCNKKAIYPKLTPNRRKRTESERRLQGIPQDRNVLQEN
jgi:hypothetical protein